MSKIKPKWIDFNTDTMEIVNNQLSVKGTASDAKDSKVSATDTTPAFLQAKVLGSSGKITTTKVNSGANETLVLGIGADVFDKTVHSTTDITEGTKQFFTNGRADARITNQKGQASGLCPLGADSLIPSAYLPNSIDEIVEGYLSGGVFFEDEAHLTEITPYDSKLYIDVSTNLQYRWSGSVYVGIQSALALGETSATAYRGDRGKTAFDHSQSAHSPSNATKCIKKVEVLTLSAGNISAKYADLSEVPIAPTAVEVFPVGGCPQLYTVDFTVVSNGSLVLRLNWSSLGLDGILADGDKLMVSYTY